MILQMCSTNRTFVLLILCPFALLRADSGEFMLVLVSRWGPPALLPCATAAVHGLRREP